MEIGDEIAMDLDRGVDNRFCDVVEVSHCSSCKCSPSPAPPRLRVTESKCAPSPDSLAVTERNWG